VDFLLVIITGWVTASIKTALGIYRQTERWGIFPKIFGVRSSESTGPIEKNDGL